MGVGMSVTHKLNIQMNGFRQEEFIFSETFNKTSSLHFANFSTSVQVCIMFICTDSYFTNQVLLVLDFHYSFFCLT
jgi:hypothetical protein